VEEEQVEIKSDNDEPSGVAMAEDVFVYFHIAPFRPGNDHLLSFATLTRPVGSTSALLCTRAAHIPSCATI
jgi:hypothetical protein